MDVTFKTNFSKQAVSKIVSKIVSDKLDCQIKINIEDLSLTHGDDGIIKLDLKANAMADESIIKKLT